MTVSTRSRRSEWLRINVVFWLTVMIFNAVFLVASEIAWRLGAPGGGVKLAIVVVAAYVFLGHNVYERINRFYESHMMRIVRRKNGSGPAGEGHPRSDYSGSGTTAGPNPTE